MLSLIVPRQEYLDGPIVPPPDGVQSNFDNPPNKNVLSRGIIICCLVLAIVFVLLRACARFQQTRRPNIVDGISSSLFTPD